MSLQDIYIVNVPIRSIAGTHSITEEDLGLKPGTLPPDEIATLGNLKVVREVLRPINAIRQKTKRLLQAGVKVGMGTALTESQLRPVKDTLDEFKAEFERERQNVIDNLDQEIEERIAEHPQYEHLIRKYAPYIKNRVEQRLAFHIDIYRMSVPPNDPNKDLLDKTMSRRGNNLSERLVCEVSEFAEGIQQSISKSDKLVRQTLRRMTDQLVPKVKSFELLDSSLSAISKYVELFIKDAHTALDAKSTGAVFLDGPELAPFEERLKVLRDVSSIKNLIAAAPKPSSWSTQAARTPAPPQQQSEAPRESRLPKRPKVTPAGQSDRARPVVNF